MSKALSKTAPAWHKQVAAQINLEASETNELDEQARRRRARLGLMLLWVKAKGKEDGSIPHGQFGPWLEQHCKALSRRTAGNYLAEANSICELLRWQNGTICQFENPPHRLLVLDTAQLKGVEKERQTKLADVVEQQKHIVAVTQYKQVELRDDVLVGRRGQMKGSKGLTKEQRLAAKEKERGATLANLKQWLEDHGDDADELADAKHAGDPEVRAEALALLPKVENLFRFLQSLK